jgi:uncharacterized BrkB/YihY/UPF0761 family membrane protein
MPIEVDSELPHYAESGEPVGRIERWRLRAENAAERYRARAQVQPLLGLPLTVMARYSARQGILLASATAFRLFLWLLPLALLLAGLLAGFSVGHQDDLRSAAKTAGVTGAASHQAVTALTDGHRSWVTAVIFGAALFVWTTLSLVRTLRIVNAHIWQADLPSRRRTRSPRIALLFDGVFLLVLAGSAGSWALQKYGVWGVFLAVLAHGLLAGFAWMLISRWLPNRASSWIDLLPGSLLFGYAFAILNMASRLYLPSRVESSSELYGSLGVAAAMLAWLLILGQVAVIASVVNSVWTDYRLDRSAAAQAP